MLMHDIDGLFAVKSSKLEDSFSLQKERRILGRFLGSNEVIGCYGDCVIVGRGVFKYNLLLEYAPKGSLLNLMKDYGGWGPESHVRKHTQMLLKGFSCIHYNGHVHCDLKPANILVFPCRDHGVRGHHLKIADFGLAREPGEDDSDKLLHILSIPRDAMLCLPRTLDSKELFNKLVRGNESPKIPENMPEKGKDFLRRCF
ncbi:mitogen-activated protein kinase kinase kinase 20 [Populus alba]